MKSIEQQFSKEVESAVTQILAASHAAAVAALEQAFNRSTASLPNRATKKSRLSQAVPKRRPAQKRSRAEIEALAEKLSALVVEFPGETMSVLAPKLGLEARQLWRPAQLLKAQGRLRTIGERQWTKYFPTQGIQ